MSIVLRATALKIQNKGGGTQWSREGSRMTGRLDTGSDYVTFICPRPTCNHRNKMSMYEAEPYSPSNEDRLPFKCRLCRTVIEVIRPSEKVSLIVTPDDFAREMANRRRDLSVRR